jgi:erythromycin esterase-like protein
VAVEADWPDAYRVNRFVRGASRDSDSVEALSGFQRFPQWMWRNADVLDFVGWLREHNDQQTFEDRKCGFYGLDLYSCMLPSKQCSLTWINLIPKRQNARDIITVVSNISEKTSPLTDTPLVFAWRRPAKMPL